MKRYGHARKLMYGMYRRVCGLILGLQRSTSNRVLKYTQTSLAAKIGKELHQRCVFSYIDIQHHIAVCRNTLILDRHVHIILESGLLLASVHV